MVGSIPDFLSSSASPSLVVFMPDLSELERVLRLCAKATLIKRKNSFMSSTAGSGYTSILRIAESTFGAGKKLFLLT